MLLHLQAHSCKEFYDNGMREDGIYYLRIGGTQFWFMKVFCDMQDGGWTVTDSRLLADAKPRQSVSLSFVAVDPT